MIKFLNDRRLKEEIHRCGLILSLSRLNAKFHFLLRTLHRYCRQICWFCFLRLRIYVSLLLDLFIYLSEQRNSNYMSQQSWSLDANASKNKRKKNVLSGFLQTQHLTPQSCPRKHFTFYDFSLLKISCLHFRSFAVFYVFIAICFFWQRNFLKKFLIKKRSLTCMRLRMFEALL